MSWSRLTITKNRIFWLLLRSSAFMCRVWMLFPCMCGFSLGALISSHRPKTCILGLIVVVGNCHRCDCQSEWVCVCLGLTACPGCISCLLPMWASVRLQQTPLTLLWVIMDGWIHAWVEGICNLQITDLRFPCENCRWSWLFSVIQKDCKILQN